MLPSVVAWEILRSLKDFIASGFRPSNQEFSKSVDNFLEDPENLAKGPYISISLPFKLSSNETEPFPYIPLGYVPYEHQNLAFSRLAPAETAKSTIIATGTGSGKTECFLLPILDYCRLHADEPGIKVIIIYPMNALAIDQARRIAKLISKPPLHNKVTAGLYIGAQFGGKEPSDSRRFSKMTSDRIIENRDQLRKNPPDILFTNYKMLDYLLTRPKDLLLWQKNQPGTFKYLVVDELHTFDGAQGTDLACLIRRLKFRLGATKQNQVICVGTSATLGSEGSSDKLIKYANGIFQEKFSNDAIITEIRKSYVEFLDGTKPSNFMLPNGETAYLLEPERYSSFDEFVTQQISLFFGDQIQANASNWKSQSTKLAQEILKHKLFHHLLELLNNSMMLKDIVEELRMTLPPELTQREMENLINSFIALISIARNREENNEDQLETPFLNIKIHLWIRELRRMVAGLGLPENSQTDEEDQNISEIQPAEIEYSDDLDLSKDKVHLPFVQCRSCRTTAWVAVKKFTNRELSTDLRTIYQEFFQLSPDIRFFYPVDNDNDRLKDFQKAKICTQCGYYSKNVEKVECSSCSSTELKDFFSPIYEHLVTKNKAFSKRKTTKSYVCPICEEKNTLAIFGVRSTTEMSIALAKLYGSVLNNDNRVLSFSDNVQNAAHKAGFIAARTWRNFFRSVIYQSVRDDSTELTLSAFVEKLPTQLTDKFQDLEFVSKFMPPDKLHWNDYKYLCANDKLPKDSKLINYICKRLEWDTFTEFTFQSSNRYSLEQCELTAVGIDQQILDLSSNDIRNELTEQIGGLKNLDHRDVRNVVLGIVRKMRSMGAVKNNLIRYSSYIPSGGIPINWGFWRPESGEGMRLPKYVWYTTPKSQGNFEYLFAPKGWFVDWIKKTLPFKSVINAQEIVDALKIITDSLISHNLLQKLPPKSSNAVIAVNPEKLYITTETSALKYKGVGQKIVVPAQEEEFWQGVPSLDLSVQGSYDTSDHSNQNWFANHYLNSNINRVIPAEFTAMVSKKNRSHLQKQFSDSEPQSWWPNLLSATPTLELGVDIGDISTVFLNSVPPSNSNYIQRIGRAGRRDGNSLLVTIATGQPHDLYHFEDPLEMISPKIAPPGVYLDAPAVLERQLIAFCLDNWIQEVGQADSIPEKVRTILNSHRKKEATKFPYTFLEFIENNKLNLVRDFTDMFEEDGLSNSSKDYLLQFVEGDGQTDSLRDRIFHRFDVADNERKSLEKERRSLRDVIKKRERQAKDKSTENKIRSLRGAVKAKSRHIRMISTKNSFAFLSDEGLLPNYTFPEEGVKLSTEIISGGGVETDSEQDISVSTNSYVRPSSIAIRELSPGNYFYAEARRVKVGRVDVNLTKPETWRLCPTCDYSEQKIVDYYQSSCPKCFSPAWADQSQTFTLLPLKNVYADPISDRKSRILDEQDDREPSYFDTKLAADFDRTSFEKSYVASSDEITLGLDYFRSTTLREINFGRVDRDQAIGKFNGEALFSSGFDVCQYCGKVQRKVQRISDSSPSHEPWCKRMFFSNSIIEGIRLYREFRSESIIFFLPIHSHSSSSLIAAIELGLQKEFEGQLSHLRIHSGKYPIGKTKELSECLVLYDTVPGGTGYLKNLMSDSNRIRGIFESARDALLNCKCQYDLKKDGCYKCVYSYHRQRELNKSSRLDALKSVEQILPSLENLEEHPEGLAKIEVTNTPSTPLERNFITELSRTIVDKQQNHVRQDIVNGKLGYVLNTGGHIYFIETQVNLNDYHGVSVPSKPDFVIRAARNQIEQRPIAIFTDGFKFHRDITSQDVVKRMALLNAGYLVWSLTWQDVDQNDESDTPNLMIGADNGHLMKPLRKYLDQEWGCAEIRKKLNSPPLELLIHFLRNPDLELWRKATFTQLLKVFDKTKMTLDLTREHFDQAADSTLPEFLAKLIKLDTSNSAVGGTGSWCEGKDHMFNFFVKLNLSNLTSVTTNNMLTNDMRAVVQLLPYSESMDQESFKLTWRGVLWLMNRLQFLQNAWWSHSLKEDDEFYDRFEDHNLYLDEFEEDTDVREEWEFVQDCVRIKDEVMVELRNRNVPVPEPFFELVDADDKVDAQVELAWPEQKIALFLQPDEDFKKFLKAGWNAFLMTDYSLVDRLVNSLK